MMHRLTDIQSKVLLIILLLQKPCVTLLVKLQVQIKSLYLLRLSCILVIINGCLVRHTAGSSCCLVCCSDLLVLYAIGLLSAVGCSLHISNKTHVRTLPDACTT